MQITFDIPEDIADRLRAEAGGSLEQSARESLLIEAYRRGFVSVGRLAEMLGMGVIEADRWLAERQVPINYTREDLEADRQTLDKLLSENRG